MRRRCDKDPEESVMDQHSTTFVFIRDNQGCEMVLSMEDDWMPRLVVFLGLRQTSTNSPSASRHGFKGRRELHKSNGFPFLSVATASGNIWTSACLHSQVFVLDDSLTDSGVELNR